MGSAPHPLPQEWPDHFEPILSLKRERDVLLSKASTESEEILAQAQKEFVRITAEAKKGLEKIRAQAKKEFERDQHCIEQQEQKETERVLEEQEEAEREGLKLSLMPLPSGHEPELLSLVLTLFF